MYRQLTCSVTGPVITNASSIANANRSVGSKKLGFTCARTLLFPAGIVEAAVFQHGFDGGWAAAPGFISPAEILSVAAREHHLAEAITVGSSEAARVEEVLIGIVGEHLRPKIGIVTRAIAIPAPDVAEVARTIARRHVGDLEVNFFERLILEVVGLEQGRI